MTFSNEPILMIRQRNQTKTIMYNDSPWTTYAAVLSPLIAGYYIIIGYKFYRADLRSAFSGKKNRPKNAERPPVPSIAVEQQIQQPAAQVTEETIEPTLPDEETFQMVEHLHAHLTVAIQEAHQKQYNKNDLIFLIQMSLKDYSFLKDTPFRISISNLIEAECAKYGSMLLSEQELEELWI